MDYSSIGQDHHSSSVVDMSAAAPVPHKYSVILPTVRAARHAWQPTPR
jgi:hypothetical protein